MKIRSKMMIVLFVAAVLPAIIIIFAYQSKLYSVLEQNHRAYIDSLSEDSVAYVRDHVQDLEKMAFKTSTQKQVIDFLKHVTNDNYYEVQNQLRTSQIGETLDFILDTYSDISYIGIIPNDDGVKICRGYYSPLNKWCTDIEFVTQYAEESGKLGEICITDGRMMHLILVAQIVDGYNDDVLGYLSVVINVQKYLDSASVIQKQQAFLVVDEMSQVIYENNISLDPEEVSFLTKTSNDNWLNFTDGGTAYIVTAKNVGAVGWKMIFLSEMDEIQKGWKETTSFMLKLVIVFVIFAVCSVIYFHIRIYRPIQILTNTMNRATKISCDLETPSGKDEIGQLGSAFKHLLERVSAQVVEIEAAERSKAELEIRALQAQITPHFLYNTLNAIKCLARLERTQDISAMVEALIDLLRISSSKERMIPIDQEAEYVKVYSELMSLRGGYDIKVTKKIDASVEQIKIPKLSLQPIVENSIIHGGIEKHNGKMVISISAQYQAPYVIIDIKDDGVGMAQDVLDTINSESFVYSSSASHFSGIGIDNIRQRFHLEYGEQVSMVFNSRINEGTSVRIKFIPNEIIQVTD